jgi:hypothetical protein
MKCSKKLYFTVSKNKIHIFHYLKREAVILFLQIKIQFKFTT